MATSYYKLFRGSDELYSVGSENGISNIHLSGKADGTSTLTFDVAPTNYITDPNNTYYVPRMLYDYSKPIRLTGANTGYTMFVGVYAKAVTQADGVMSVTCTDVLAALDSMYMRLGEVFPATYRKGINKLSVSSIMSAVSSTVKTMSQYTSVSVTYGLASNITSEIVEVDMTARKSVLDVITEYVTGPRNLMLLSYTPTSASDATTLRLYITDGITQRTTSSQLPYNPDTIEVGKNVTSIKVTRKKMPYNAFTAYGGKRKTPVTDDTNVYNIRWIRKFAVAGSIGDTSVTIEPATDHPLPVKLYKGAYLNIYGEAGEDIFYEVAIDDDYYIPSSSETVTIPIRPALQSKCGVGRLVYVYPNTWFSDKNGFLGWTDNEVTTDSQRWSVTASEYYDPAIGYMRPIGRNTAMIERDSKADEEHKWHPITPVRALLYENDAIMDHRLLLRMAYKALSEAASNSQVQIEVNGIDPVMLNNSSSLYPMRVGSRYRIIDSRQSVDVEMTVFEAQIDVCAPERSTVVFGSMRGNTATALMGQRKATQEVRSRIQAG